MTNSIQEIKEWVSKDQLDDAILGIKCLLAKPFENEIGLLENRYHSWKKDEIIGTAEAFEKRKIQCAFLDLLDELSQVSEQSPSGLTFTQIVPIKRNDIIREILKKLTPAITFRYPYRNTTITTKTITASGKILLDLPSEYQLWMLQKINGFYYHTDRPIVLDLVNNRWNQKNLNFTANGKSELVICLVSEKGANILNSKIAKEDWYGFSSTPRGIYPIKSVPITKE